MSFEFGAPFRRADLDVRWNAPSNALPVVLWVYRALPTKFSPIVISNLMALGSFSEKDKTDYGTNGMVFETVDRSRRLALNYNWGTITYDDHAAAQHGATNLSFGVPTSNQVLKLVADFLPELGIRLSEVSRETTNSEPRMNVFNEEEIFYINGTFVTNIPMRGVRFRRAVDGAEFTGVGKGGDCQIEFGNRGKICEMEISWRDLERDKAYKAAAPETITKWMREGKAVQSIIFTNTGDIDWATVKCVTIQEADPCYLGQYRPVSKSWVYPYVALNTIVDTGDRKINVELDCPVIDQTKPLNGAQVTKPNSP